MLEIDSVKIKKEILPIYKIGRGTQTTLDLNISMSALMVSKVGEETTSQSKDVKEMQDYSTIVIEVGKDLKDVYVMHNGNPMVESDNIIADEGQGVYKYNSTDGTVTIKTRTFSPFTVIGTKPIVFPTVGKVVPEGCTSLVNALAIPECAKGIDYIFMDCTLLETAPEVPESVVGMCSAFDGCTSLKGTITINGTPNGSSKDPTKYNYNPESNSYTSCFKNCAKDADHAIVITGASEKLDILKSTGYNNGEFITIIE